MRTRPATSLRQAAYSSRDGGAPPSVPRSRSSTRSRGEVPPRAMKERPGGFRPVRITCPRAPKDQNGACGASGAVCASDGALLTFIKSLSNKIYRPICLLIENVADAGIAAKPQSAARCGGGYSTGVSALRVPATAWPRLVGARAAHTKTHGAVRFLPWRSSRTDATVNDHRNSGPCAGMWARPENTVKPRNQFRVTKLIFYLIILTCYFV